MKLAVGAMEPLWCAMRLAGGLGGGRGAGGGVGGGAGREGGRRERENGRGKKEKINEGWGEGGKKDR